MQEPNPLGGQQSSGNIMRGAAANVGDLKKLKLYIKALKKLQKGLKEESVQYKALEKDAKKLEGVVKQLVTGKTALTKAAEALTTQLGSSGVGGGITRFSSAAIDASTSVNQLDGTMTVFGKTTNMSSASFAGWTAAIQLAIAAVIKLAAVIDEAQVKQANLQRSFGAGNVSIRESFDAIVSGMRAAGDAGAKAAPQLNAALRAARGAAGGDLMAEMGGTSGQTFNQLVKYDVAFPVDLSGKIRELAETFNIRTAGGMNSQIENLLDTILKSGLPMERYSDLIVSLGTTFADVGIDIGDTGAILSIFSDRVNNSYMTMGLAVKMGQASLAQQTTSAGFQGRVLTAAFAQEMTSAMDPNTVKALDDAAKKVYGDDAKFGELSAYDASNVLADRDATSAPLYMKAMEGVYLKLMDIEKISGLGAAGQAAQAMGMPEWQEFRKAGPSLKKGELSYEEFQRMTMTADERMLEAANTMAGAANTHKEIAAHADNVADLNKQWYSDFAAFWTNALTTVVEVLGGGADIFGTIQDIAGFGIPAAMTNETIGQLADWTYGTGAYSPEEIERKEKFAAESGGITMAMLEEYAKSGGRMDTGLAMGVGPDVDLEIARKKFVGITFYVHDGIGSQPVGGTPGHVSSAIAAAQL